MQQNNQSNSKSNKTQWNALDTTWVLSLFGTAVGAGILFLPINAGLKGFWPLVVLTIIIGPMTYLSHRGLSRFVLSSKNPENNIIEVAEEHFGKNASKLLTLLYFFAIFPIVLIYAVGITNTMDSFIENQLHLVSPPRSLLSLFLILIMMSVMMLGEKLMLKITQFLVYPLITILLFMSLFLVPSWNTSALMQVPSTGDFLSTLWISIPVLVFAFNHSPAISAFSMAQAREYGDAAEIKASKVLFRTAIILVGFVMLFVFSCVLSLTPDDLTQAKSQNISILSYLANKNDSPFIAYLGPIVAFVAIVSSFFGHYLGTREGLNGIITQIFMSRGKEINEKKLNTFTAVFVIISCWIVATLNPSILGLIESLGGPIIAAILFIMPMYAIKKVPAMQKYANKLNDYFVVITGLIAISAIFIGFLV